MLVWSPRLRPLVLAGAVVLHVGIGACLGMWTFGLIMLVGCASFLPDEAVRQLVAALAPGRIAATPAARPFYATLPGKPSIVFADVRTRSRAHGRSRESATFLSRAIATAHGERGTRWNVMEKS